LTELDLSHNLLTTLPKWLGQLTQLKSLNLSNNQLTALPESLGQLTQLHRLYLYTNQIVSLPESLEKLQQLEILNLADNGLESIPNVVQKLKSLEILIVSGNQISNIPPWLSELNQLTNLSLGDNVKSGNPLLFLPDDFDRLENLNKLTVRDCRLTNIPLSLARLKHLRDLDLHGNPLNPALQSAYDQGLDAVKAYLRSLEKNAEPLYEAKLVLVGEGNVGKTTLLKALKGKEGEAPQEHETTTHGVEIDIHGLRLPHPAKDGVEIQLNAWDFGGQDVYRVTHQFFFSRRSLYLLVWEPRRGVQ
jgi:hypothetical protein